MEILEVRVREHIHIAHKVLYLVIKHLEFVIVHDFNGYFNGYRLLVVIDIRHIIVLVDLVEQEVDFGALLVGEGFEFLRDTVEFEALDFEIVVFQIFLDGILLEL